MNSGDGLNASMSLIVSVSMSKVYEQKCKYEQSVSMS